MRKTAILSTALLLAFTFALAGKPEAPSLTIDTHKLNLKIDDTADLVVTYVDSDGVEIDTVVTWWVEPDSLGPIDSLNIFTATLEGEGYIYAQLGELKDSIEVTVRGIYEPPEELPYLIVLPSDTVLTVGDTIQFTAWTHDSSGTLFAIDSVTWSMDDTSDIGTLDSTGLFIATTPGYGFVEAATDSGSGNSLINVEMGADSSSLHTITITRDNPSPQGYNVMKTIREGESWTVAGLPHPLNVLNGGLLTFPEGSLHEDIRLHISLPDFAHIQGDSIEFGYGVVSGLAFHVMVNDTEVVSPYYFDSPLFVALIFKRGLVNKMGIKPENLTLSYAEIDGDTITFDDAGITNVYVDSVRNRVFSNVAHFSSLALRDGGGSSVSVGDGAPAMPRSFELTSIYPNPFNPTALVTLELPATANVEVSVFNLLGQHVAYLHRGALTAGQHQFRFDGSDLASGVYLVRASSDAGTQHVRKMVLLK